MYILTIYCNTTDCRCVDRAGVIVGPVRISDVRGQIPCGYAGELISEVTGKRYWLQPA